MARGGFDAEAAPKLQTRPRRILAYCGRKMVLTMGSTLAPQPASLETATGQIVGTACYVSPEQARGETVDARTDIFSFGALLYEIVTVERPFDTGSLAGTLSAILRDTPVPVRELRRDTPRDVARLARRCLEKD